MRLLGWDGPQFAKAAEYLEICTGEKLDGWDAFEDALMSRGENMEAAKRIWQNWKSRRQDEPGEIKIIMDCR